MPPSEGVAVAAAAQDERTMEAHVAWDSQRDLNFGGAVHCEEEEESFRRRTSRDPMSHRIIEKRRRDRMNSCLADLSRLIPAEYLKRGRGRIEKTEIIEMAIRHMRHLHESQSFLSAHPTTTPPPSSSSPGSTTSSSSSTANCRQELCDMADDSGGGFGRFGGSMVARAECTGEIEQYRLGFLECLSEVMHFLIEIEGFPASGSLCLSLDSHLRAHCSAMLKGDKPPSPKADGSLDKQYRFNGGPIQGKRELPGLELQVSEEEPELMNHQAENQDYEEMEPNELKVILTHKECEFQSESASSIISQESGASYKFKNNIKRRFTAGLEKRKKIEEGERSKVKKDYMDTSVLLTLPHQSALSSATAYLQQNSGTSQVPYQMHHQDSIPTCVPVFALHSERSFYVPLMLDPETLAPHASLLSKQAPALHPVTISVNFCNGVEGDCDVEKSSAALSGSRESLPSNATLPLLSMSANTLRN